MSSSSPRLSSRRIRSLGWGLRFFLSPGVYVFGLIVAWFASWVVGSPKRVIDFIVWIWGITIWFGPSMRVFVSASQTLYWLFGPGCGSVPVHLWFLWCMRFILTSFHWDLWAGFVWKIVATFQREAILIAFYCTHQSVLPAIVAYFETPNLSRRFP